MTQTAARELSLDDIKGYVMDVLVKYGDNVHYNALSASVRENHPVSKRQAGEAMSALLKEKRIKVTGDGFYSLVPQPDTQEQRAPAVAAESAHDEPTAKAACPPIPAIDWKPIALKAGAVQEIDEAWEVRVALIMRRQCEHIVAQANRMQEQAQQIAALKHEVDALKDAQPIDADAGLKATIAEQAGQITALKLELSKAREDADYLRSGMDETRDIFKAAGFEGKLTDVAKRVVAEKRTTTTTQAFTEAEAHHAMTGE